MKKNLKKDPIDIDEVCLLAKVSKSTVYSRVKRGEFPKPEKVASNNRWDRNEVMAWLLQGNDPEWAMKITVKELKAACAKLDKMPITSHELDPEIQPGINALFGEHQMSPEEIARRRERPEDIYDFEPVEEPSRAKRHVAQAIIAALLAGIAVMIYHQ